MTLDKVWTSLWPRHFICKAREMPQRSVWSFPFLKSHLFECCFVTNRSKLGFYITPTPIYASGSCKSPYILKFSWTQSSFFRVVRSSMWFFMSGLLNSRCCDLPWKGRDQFLTRPLTVLLNWSLSKIEHLVEFLNFQYLVGDDIVISSS